MPDIKGSGTLPSVRSDNYGLSGTYAFKRSIFTGTSYCSYGKPGQGDWNFQFYASDSNSIYGSSETVQPPTIALIVQIKY